MIGRASSIVALRQVPQTPVRRGHGSSRRRRPGVDDGLVAGPHVPSCRTLRRHRRPCRRWAARPGSTSVGSARGEATPAGFGDHHSMKPDGPHTYRWVALSVPASTAFRSRRWASPASSKWVCTEAAKWAPRPARRGGTGGLAAAAVVQLEGACRQSVQRVRHGDHGVTPMPPPTRIDTCAGLQRKHQVARQADVDLGAFAIVFSWAAMEPPRNLDPSGMPRR